MQREYDEAIELRDLYKDWYDKEKDKSQKLSEEIESLKLQVSAEPTTDNVSDDELGYLSKKDIKELATESITGEPRKDEIIWYAYYDVMGKAELIKRLKYVETISDRRADQIRELKKDLRSKRYDQYSQEDSVTYNEALSRIGSLKSEVKMYQEWLGNANRRNEELTQKVTKLASATLPPEESIKVVEENIKQDQELKKANQKKKGRPVTMDEHTIALIHELHKNGHSIRAIAKQIGKSVGTVHRILNEQ